MFVSLHSPYSAERSKLQWQQRQGLWINLTFHWRSASSSLLLTSSLTFFSFRNSMSVPLLPPSTCKALYNWSVILSRHLQDSFTFSGRIPGRSRGTHPMTLKTSCVQALTLSKSFFGL